MLNGFYKGIKMTDKSKIIVSVTVTAFLAAAAVLITNILLLSYLIDSEQTINKINTITLFIFMSVIVAIVLIAVSIPINLKMTKNLLSSIKNAQDQIQFDPLTGIYNRRYVDENIRDLIGFMSRMGGKLTLMMVSIDFFKSYNETYGFINGDNCLKIIASALKMGVSRAEDIVARYGGKEFIVVLPITDENGAVVVAERMLSMIRNYKIPHEKSEASDILTISIGVVTGTVSHMQNGEEYISRALELMKKSIHDGCNRSTFGSLNKTDDINS